MRSRLRGHGLWVAAGLVLAAGTAVALGVAMEGSRPIPGPGLSDGTLSSVAVVSPWDAWAVGSARAGHTISKAALIEHWNGRSWERVTSPGPALPSQPVLAGVAAVSPADVWAVGTVSDFHGDPRQTRPLFEHWNGHSWRVSVAAGPAILEAVAAISADDAWAAGAQVIRGGGSSTLIEHWNGRAWRVVPSPSPGPSGGYPGFWAVAATSADDVWAVGKYDAGPPLFQQSLIEHWNGRAWTQLPAPAVAAELTGVAAASARNAWAVGYTFGAAPSAVALHWDGRVWRQVAVPSPQNVQLAGVTMAPGCPAWAVGYAAFPQSQQGSAVTYRWTGHAWVHVPSPRPAGSASLSGVREPRSCRPWAVGGYGTPGSRSLIERWDGRAWAQVPSPLNCPHRRM